MAQHTTTVLVCDFCQGEDDVETHTVTVDRWKREVEACGACWSGIGETLERVRSAGRQPGRR